MKTLLFFLLSFAWANIVWGQTYYISNNPTFDSVIVIPANPTNNDSINFIIHISNEVQGISFFKAYDSLGNQLNNVKISNDSIYIYETSMGPFYDTTYTTYQFTDTVKIGNIESGQYSVLLINILSSSMWPSPPPSYIDTAEFNLSVITSSGFNTFDNSESINLYPIPAKEKTSVSLKHGQISNIKLFDLTGRQILNEKLICSQNLAELDISTLVAGIYFIKVTTNDNSIFTGKLVKINSEQ